MIRSKIAGLGVAATVAIGGLALSTNTATAADPTPEDLATLAAAGINAAELAPGWTIEGDEIRWGDSIAATLGPAAYDDCPSGWVCLFQDKNYAGRMLKFQDVGLNGDMRDYSFNDQMSSWRSRRALDARWYYDYNGSGTSRCMESVSSNTDVGAGFFNADNDEMSSFRIYSTDDRC